MANFSIIEWLQNAKQDPKQAAVPLVVLATIIFFIYNFSYKPVKIKLLKKEKEIKSIKSELSNLKSASSNKDEIELNIANQKKKFDNSTKLCYKKNEITSYLRHVREIATKSGIKVKSIIPKPQTPIQVGNISVEQLPVSFNFEGDLKNLGIFLRMIELEEKVTFIKLPKLIANKEGKFNLVLEPTIIIVPDNFSLDSIMNNNSESEEEEEDYE